MDEAPKDIPSKEFLEHQIRAAQVNIERNDAIVKFCQAMIEKGIYVEKAIDNGSGKIT